CLQYKSYPYNF
nr:immunoglobulin light chain junction region [Macaca mulatta]MOV82192.1 immunoglobulin light chain junction region [Macaca mulatta]MOV86425.1 immunoglobulin light chain junction region [Macaca mulatta]